MVAEAARRHVEVHVSLTGREDLSGEIYRQLRRAILDGRMRPGDALPPSRELARQLGISRTTVTVAYDKLWSEGLVAARVGAGTFISEAVAGANAGPSSATSPGLLRPRAVWDAFARALLAPGDYVAVEDPGYLPARRLFQSLGGRIVGVPVDREGLLVERLPDEARLVYVTPSHQYPLGMPMSFRRRLALIEWGRRHTAAIVENDYHSEV